jgi:hypothetical protein
MPGSAYSQASRHTRAGGPLPWSWAPPLAVGKRMDVSFLGPDSIGKSRVCGGKRLMNVLLRRKLSTDLLAQGGSSKASTCRRARRR